MRLSALVDPIANLLLDLQKVSRTQWILRLIGVAAMVLALFGALPTGMFANFLAGLVSTLALCALLIQVFRPDTDIGVASPLLIILALLSQSEVSALQALGVGAAMLVSHAAFALAATIPAHGVFEGSAWRLALRAMLPVIALSLIAALVVMALSGIRLGPWMLVVGIAAVISLFLLVLPRTR
ncbi:hypothetical protein ACTXON_00860 [Brachybacterium alimentarium]|uniref:hypothetical protein n=1 Tax=Brachybacterium alimentarium TaxID=47845 RepID=UPI0031D2307A